MFNHIHNETTVETRMWLDVAANVCERELYRPREARSEEAVAAASVESELAKLRSALELGTPGTSKASRKLLAQEGEWICNSGLICKARFKGVSFPHSPLVSI